MLPPGHLPFLLVFAGLACLLAWSLVRMRGIRARADALAASEERCARAVDVARIGIWDWNAETGKLVWSGHAFKILGAPSNEALPDTDEAHRNMIHPADGDRIRERVLADAETEGGFTVDYRVRRHDGGEVWVQSRGRVVEKRAGRPVRFNGTLMDITDRKLVEENLKRSNQELEQFAYVASHDLKAPLRGIDNLAKWIAEDMGDSLPPDATEKLNLMRSRVSRLEKLLEDILKYSRAGRIVGNLETVDVRDLVSGIAADFGDKKEFRINVPASMPVIVTARTPLEQVFSNLITNAVRHHDRGGGVIDVTAHDNGDFYEFCVRDDGPGIPPEFHERVFGMFQTLQSRDRKEGSGLGMAIVKKLVEWQGGRVWIVSAEGKRGTEIHFLWAKNIQKRRMKDAA